MSKNTEKFLEAYKKLETMLRKTEQYNNVFEYESILTDPETVEKLKLCRLIRNYIVHNENGADFVVPTNEMISFITKQCQEVQKLVKTVGAICTPVTSIKSDSPMTIRMVLKKINDKNLNFYPVADEKTEKMIGVIDFENIVSAIQHADYKLTAKFFENVSLNNLKNNLKNNYVIANKDEEYSKYTDTKKSIIVTNDEGNCIGVIAKE